jgi:hypothetical protein
MLIKKIIKNKQGDTIVEVLIGIAVLGFILSMSYALSNRDTQYIQQSQERGEAQKISEQQLELLRHFLTPDTDWNASGYLCFDEGNPLASPPISPQPTTAANKCQKGTKDNIGGILQGRYRVRIQYDSPTKTYTVNTTWSSLTSAPQQALAISYKLPASYLTPVGLLPECSDGIDNIDPEDTLVDRFDRACHTDLNAANIATYDPSLGSETDPPPPPPPPVVHTWSTTGSSYSYCGPDNTLYAPFGDGADGCFRTGSSMFTYRGINALYGGIPSGFQAGSATLTICYQNYASNPPPGYSGYKLMVTPGHGPTQGVTLPAASPSSQRCEDTTIDLAEADLSTLRIVWYNDDWVGGDANLMINSIKISQDLDPNPQKPNMAIAGRNYTTCQIAGNPGYCILSDALYRSSVYSLSSDTSISVNSFKTTYKFTGLTPGSYNLGVSYFNGDYGNLPAPPGYSYKVKISYPGGTTTVNMPIDNNLMSRHLHDYTLNNLNITGSSPVITLEWLNDSYNPGVYDANLGINSVLLQRN